MGTVAYCRAPVYRRIGPISSQFFSKIFKAFSSFLLNEKEEKALKNFEKMGIYQKASVSDLWARITDSTVQVNNFVYRIIQLHF